MKEVFGNLKHLNEIDLYTLENDAIKATMTNYGATLVSLIDKDSGIDVVLGYETLEEYVNHPGYLGASVGRVANRIKDGQFTLNGKQYHLAQNDRGNHLHGGLVGFDKVVWDGKEKENQVIFSYLSKDEEEGYPGDLEVSVTYTLLEDGISITTNAKSNQDTLFAYTNHAYFNCDGKGEVKDHHLQLQTNTYTKNDQNALTQEGIYDAADTVFDFSKPKRLGDGLDSYDAQIQLCGGYDHHFPIPGHGLRKMVTFSGKALTLTMESDYPGLHIYVSHFETPRKGKHGISYIGRASACFEAEYYPNAINYDSVEEKPL